MTPQHTREASRSKRDVFPGPRPFQRDEADLFFGRERESEDLRDLILSYRSVVLYAQSGAGKSSLVNASLIPKIEAEGYTVMRGRVAGGASAVRASDDIPNIYVLNTVLSALPQQIDLAINPESLNFSRIVTDEAPRLLILDQFEEFFTCYPDRWREREPFMAAVQQVMREHRELRVLFVIREDHLASIDPFSNVFSDGFRFRYHLQRLRAPSARDAILRPLERAGYSVESDVPDQLVQELLKERVQKRDGVAEVQGEFVEPLHLQLVCRDLWSHLPADPIEITSAHAQGFANVDEALATFYGAAVARSAKQTHVPERRVRQWFEQEMITPAGTRGIVYGGEQETAGIPTATVHVLVEEHVLRAEPRAGALWYELTHDRFITPIRTANRCWVRARNRRYLRRALGLVGALFLVASILALTTQLMRSRVAAVVAESQKYQFLQLYASSAPGGDDQLETKYWVSRADGGSEIDSVRAGLSRLRQNRLHYGPDSRIVKLSFRYIKVNIFRGVASVGTTEAWYLPMFDIDGQRYTKRKAEQGPFDVDYSLRRIRGRWLIQSTTTPYVK